MVSTYQESAEHRRAEGPDTPLYRLSGWGNWRGRSRGVLLVVLTLTIFWILFRRINLQEVLRLLRVIPPRTWVAAALLTVSFPIFSALRWCLTLRAIGCRLPFSRSLTIILGTSPVSAIAPSKAGDLLKAISLRGEIGLLEVGGTVLTERALDVLLLASLSLVGGLALGHRAIAQAAAVVIGAGLIGLTLLPLMVAATPTPRLREKLERLLRVLGALRARPALAAGVLLLTAVNWLASIIQTHLLLLAVGAPVSFLLTATVLPIAIFVGLVPVTIGGMGTRDAALVSLLASAATPAQALSVGLLYSFFGYWLPALLGLPFFRSALFTKRG